MAWYWGVLIGIMIPIIAGLLVWLLRRKTPAVDFDKLEADVDRRSDEKKVLIEACREADIESNPFNPPGTEPD